MHLTLVFIGDIDESSAAAVVDVMRPVINAAPFTTTFAGLGVFPPHGSPSVLWLGVGAGSQDVVAVQRLVVSRLAPIGIAPDRRPYHPHVTLARWRKAKSADRRIVVAADREADVARVPVTLLTVYQSRLSSGGPAHTPLVRVAFA